MQNLYSSIYKSFILSSVICFIIYIFTTENVSYGSMVTGYCTLTFSLFMILFVIFNNILETTKNDSSTYKLISNILFLSGPFILMLIAIGLVLYLIIFYKNKILSQHIPNSFYTFSNINILLLLIQIYIIYNNLNNSNFEETKKLDKITSSLLYLLGTITFINSIIIFSILRYFSADGFQSYFTTAL